MIRLTGRNQGRCSLPPPPSPPPPPPPTPPAFPPPTFSLAQSMECTRGSLPFPLSSPISDFYFCLFLFVFSLFLYFFFSFSFFLSHLALYNVFFLSLRSSSTSYIILYPPVVCFVFCLYFVFFLLLLRFFLTFFIFSSVRHAVMVDWTLKASFLRSSSSSSFRPDTRVMVDWALKTNFVIHSFFFFCFSFFLSILSSANLYYVS